MRIFLPFAHGRSPKASVEALGTPWPAWAPCWGRGALLTGIQAALTLFKPLAGCVGGDGKGCVRAGRRSGWKGDEAATWRDTQGGRVSLNNSLCRDIFYFSNIISHRTGCTGIHAGWEGGREGGVGAVTVLHWTDFYWTTLAIVPQHPRS